MNCELISVSLADKAKGKAKKNPTWLLGILLAVHLIAVSLNRTPGRPDLWIIQVGLMTIMAPFQSGVAYSTGSVKNWWTTYFSMKDARLENEKLRAERAELETQYRDLREKLKLLERVDALREWQTANKFEGQQARVIGRDANKLFDTIFIDKGLSSGVIKDQPVVTAEGLVGRVINSWPLSAQVLLITDEKHGAGAIIGQTEESRFLGVVKGKKDYLCEFRFISPPGKVENGEQVITSGQDGIYPKGLLIGRVKKSDSGSTVVLQVIDLEPAAPLGKLETVSVLAVQPNQIRQQDNELTSEQKKQDKAPDRIRR
ncbi:MAG: rod shape-determining protein MreC [Acidobacteria bacterium]|nr:rod shape-determining protein MreC [Acidobacteriota bacterium]